MLSNEYLMQCSSRDLIDIVREYEAAFADSAERVDEIERQLTARIAELERQLAQRTGRVHESNRRVDAILQTPQYDPLWA